MSMQLEFRWVYITAGSPEEAARIGRALVEERLAACANLLPDMVSLYWWEGKVERSQEAVLIAKTKADKIDALTQRVKELHPYSVPCVLSLPILGGNADYLNWIEESLRQPEQV